MEDGDDGLVLNLVSASDTPHHGRQKNKSKSSKKQQLQRRVTHQGSRSGKHRQSPAGSLRHPQAPVKQAVSALKGYVLEAAVPTQRGLGLPAASKVASDSTAATKPAKQGLTAPRKRQRISAIRSPHFAGEAALQSQQLDTKASQAAGEATPVAGGAHRQEREDTPELVNDEAEEADVLAVVALARQRDSAIEACLSEQHGEGPQQQAMDEDSESDEELYSRRVVTFPNSTAPAKKRQKLQVQPAKAKGPPLIHHKPGELAHASTATPALQKLHVFGPVDSSTFQGLGLTESLASHLDDINFSVPTRIQQAVIPLMLAGRDVVASAATGSGKTLSYLAPIIHNLQAKEPRISRASGTHAIIVAPTRELCLQITDVLGLILRRYHWLVGGTIFGGENRAKEKARLRKGVTVLVATPGRLLDHLHHTTAFATAQLSWLVLDEADRLLDLGFEQKIAEIVELLDHSTQAAGRTRGQTALLSATMNSRLGRLVTLSLKNPALVGFTAQLKDGELLVSGGEFDAHSNALQGQQTDAEHYSIPTQLQQQVVEVPAKLRLAALAALLRAKCGNPESPNGKQPAAKVVVFMSSCDGVDYHHQLLSDLWPLVTGAKLVSCSILKLHGNLAQTVRTSNFLEFSKCASGVLLCTDVAARGLDFPLCHNHRAVRPAWRAFRVGRSALPEYVHRVGRTARMGEAGEALLFLLPSEQEYQQELASRGVALRRLDLLPLLDHLPQDDAGRRPPQRGRWVGDHEGAQALQRRLVAAVEQDPQLRRLGEDAFRSFVRAYAAHPASVKRIFHVKRLHLGHVADSFALREPPSLIGRSTSKASKLKQSKAVEAAHRKSRLHSDRAATATGLRKKQVQ